MDVGTFCAQSHVLVVAGKGGVGKTTMTAALARMASQAGLSVLIVELEGKSGITGAFGLDHDLGYGEGELVEVGSGGTGPVRARRITPDDALVEYLVDHGLKRVSKRLVSSGVIDVVATAIPGIRDVLVLGKIKQLERERSADLIVVDAPATGHAITFLTSASGLLDAARGGPVRAQAADVVALLTDPARSQVALVTLPEEMPVNEVVDAAYQLEDKVGITLGPIIVNGCYEPVTGLAVPAAEAAEAAGVDLDDGLGEALDAASTFRRTREALQQEQIQRLSHELPLPELRVPFAFTASIGPEELQVLADALATGIAKLPDVEATVS